jgi:enoyl-CoA hydratase/carnithine racemase
MTSTDHTAPDPRLDPSTPITEYPESDELRRELDEHGVLLLTFDRPERNNGWTHTLEDAYFGSLLAAANDPAVRSIVITGAGRAFCPGMDLQILEQSARNGTPSGMHRRWPMTTARLVPKPVIGAINGACAGIGFIHLASCDVAFASTAAKFTTSFARRGLPAENSLSWMLPRLVGTSNAMDLLLSARVVLADEALELGLVSKVVEPDELLPTALAYARDLAANCSPVSMAHIKRQVLDDWERTSEESRLRALVLMSEMGVHPDFKEGVMSFQEKRPAAFSGLDAHLHVSKSINR